ncbi:MAG: GGDEF domain-containing protein [Acidobacteriia bacterium]|nr:GGDEF domain-containing protein [Terriglobia bacterium]
MENQPDLTEQLGPQSRLKAELFKLESQRRELWVLIVFAASVLALGAFSLLMPRSFWHDNVLELRISPQVLFVVMMVLVVVALYVMRRELEVKKLRLASLQQLLDSRTEQAVSMIDAVTNVFTRSFMHDLLQGEVARAERNSRPLSLIMADLDNFKQVNDRFGHLMGDYILSQVASILKACVRGSDYIIRYGGDEFLVLLPETDEKGGEVVRHRIQQKLAEWDETHRIGDYSVAISMGLSTHVSGQSGEHDVAEADARMYAEKQSARTRASVTSQSGTP